MLVRSAGAASARFQGQPDESGGRPETHSAQGATELGKALAKVLLLGTIGYWLVARNLPHGS